MSWHFSRALVAEFSEAICLAGEPSALSSTTPTPEAFYWPDKTTEHSRLSRFGMTSEPLTVDLGEDLLMWFREASLVKTSLPKERGQGSKARTPGSGDTWRASLAKFDRDSRSLKTVQSSLFPDSIECSPTLPQWGSMRNGEIYQRPRWGPRICEIESGLLPTPRVSRGYTNPTAGKERKDCLTTRILGRPVLGMRPRPEYVEWMMGFPIGWTELKGLETGRFQEWLQQHSPSLPSRNRRAA